MTVKERERLFSFPTLALPIKVSVRFGSLILPREREEKEREKEERERERKKERRRRSFSNSSSFLLKVQKNTRTHLLPSSSSSLSSLPQILHSLFLPSSIHPLSTKDERRRGERGRQREREREEEIRKKKNSTKLILSSLSSHEFEIVGKNDTNNQYFLSTLFFCSFHSPPPSTSFVN